MITLGQLKNRILTLCDTSENFINNMDSDAFTNLVNDSQIELFRTLYTIYNEEMAQTYEDYTVAAGDGYIDFSSAIAMGYGYSATEVNMPFVIFRIDHLVDTTRLAMNRFTIANKKLSITTQSWGSNNVSYDWRPPRIYFNPINTNEETVRIYYVPRPSILTSDDGYIHWISADHIELFTIIAAMKVFAKGETPTTELQRLHDNYISRIKTMLPIDHGQVKHIEDVQNIYSLYDETYLNEQWEW